jgi:hypothetical protein
LQRRGAGTPRGQSRGWIARWALAALLVVPSTAQQPSPRDPLARLQRWIARYSGQEGDREWEKDSQDLGRLLDEIGALDLRAPERRVEIAAGLLDLAALQNAEQRAARPDLQPLPTDARTLALQERARALLKAQLDGDAAGELARALAVRVLADARANPLPRRVAAVELLAGRRLPAIETALLFCAQSGEPALAHAALAALSGWSDEAVHRVMAAALARSLDDPRADVPTAALAHFAGVTLPAESSVRAIVQRYLARGAASADWRVATRSIAVARALSDDEAAPVLIQALQVWCDRRESGRGSRRVEGEIVRELERRAGQPIGPHPERWFAWWKARRAGGTASGVLDTGTHIAFFGLRPETDRVVFVLDRSGSMDEPFGVRGASRFQEAVAELFRCLEALGPGTRFRVVLFSGQPWVWHRDPVLATPSALSELRVWLAGQKPAGGTALAPAFAEALELGPGASSTRRGWTPTPSSCCATARPPRDRAGSRLCSTASRARPA